MQRYTHPKFKLSQLQALVAVATYQDLGKAADALGRSVAGISHEIVALENQLSIVLLLRGRSGTAITPLGELIAEDAQAILSQLNDLEVKIERISNLYSGRIRVSSFHSVTTHVLTSAIATLCQQFPHIQVDVVDYDCHHKIEQTLRDGQADIGFTLMPADDEFELLGAITLDLQARSLPVPRTHSIGVVTQTEAQLPSAAFAFLDILQTVWFEPRSAPLLGETVGCSALSQPQRHCQHRSSDTLCRGCQR